MEKSKNKHHKDLVQFLDGIPKLVCSKSTKCYPKTIRKQLEEKRKVDSGAY